MIESVTLTFARYRTPDGKPTCAVDFRDGRVCQFLGRRKAGQQDVCMLGVQRDLDGPMSFGHTRPDDKCLIWEGEQ